MTTIITKSDKETEELGFQIAKKIKKGQVFLLYGELGAGKTTFTRGFAKGLGINNRIISPTFTIIRDFDIPKKNKVEKLYHIDLYRLNSVKEIEGLGIFDLFNKNNIIVIEWPEKMGDKIPKVATKIKLEYKEDSKRKITINE